MASGSSRAVEPTHTADVLTVSRKPVSDVALPKAPPSSYSVLVRQGQIALVGAFMTEWMYEDHTLNTVNTL